MALWASDTADKYTCTTHSLLQEAALEYVVLYISDLLSVSCDFKHGLRRNQPEIAEGVLKSRQSEYFIRANSVLAQPTVHFTVFNVMPQ